MKIFGYEWEEIKAAQQGGKLRKLCPELDAAGHAIVIMRDVERFGMPVHDSVKTAYNLELPEHYAMDENSTWKPAP